MHYKKLLSSLDLFSDKVTKKMGALMDSRLVDFLEYVCDQILRVFKFLTDKISLVGILLLFFLYIIGGALFVKYKSILLQNSIKRLMSEKGRESYTGEEIRFMLEEKELISGPRIGIIGKALQDLCAKNVLEKHRRSKESCDFMSRYCDDPEGEPTHFYYRYSLRN